MAKIIALTGKGGVGKTTICSAFVRILGEKYPEAKILAIDADPAVGLSTALGVTVQKTLDDLRREIIDLAASGAGREAVEMLGEVRYRIFEALEEMPGYAFLAIGRPEGAGCYCAVNAYLKEVIEMISRDFDYVVIDGEAGIEQINRRVMEQVDVLFLVSDASRKGLQVAASIYEVAKELVQFEKCGLILNRVEDPELLSSMAGAAEGKLLAMPKELAKPWVVIAGDPAHAKNDVLGKSIFELPANSPVCQGAAAALERMGL